MTDKKIHSVDYIRAIKEYLKLRSITDDLTPQAQVHLQYLASLVRANGTAAVGYRELQRLRLSPKTISANFKRFRELGMIHKVDIGHANQFGKGGTVSTYHFNLAAILRLNSESADFPLGEASKSKVLTSQGGSADFPEPSADFPKGVEPLPSRGSTPEELCPEQTLPEELYPEASEKSGAGFLGVVSDSDSKSPHPTTITTSLNPSGKATSIPDIQKESEYGTAEQVTKTLTLPWMTEPSDFRSTRLPNLSGVQGDRRHSRLTFNTDKGLLNWLRLLDTRFDFRTSEDEIITRLAPDGKWAVDTHGIAHVSATNVLSTGLRDCDPVSGDMTVGEGKYRKLKPEFLPCLPVCGCGARVFHLVRMSKDTGVLHTSTVCVNERCAFAKAQEVADDKVAQRESLTRHYGGVSIPDPVALFNADIPLGEKPGDAHQIFGAKQAVVADSMWLISGVGLVAGTSYKDAEQKVREQREAYLDKKCLVGVV
jgi:hypothetical protein